MTAHGQRTHGATNVHMNRHLVLFFTRGVSLRTWSMVGMLDREIALYQRLMEHGYRVSFVTYGDATDLDYCAELGGISILCNVSGLPLERYEEDLFEIHGRELRSAHVFKTNQTYGGELVLKAARIFDKPLIARCGYMWSWNAEREHGRDSAVAREARRVEETVFSAAQRVVVTSQTMRSDLMNRIPAVSPPIWVIPNYVDVDLFQPQDSSHEETAVLFIGRIAPEKNLDALLRAIQPLDLRLILVGEGKLRPHLQARFGDLDGRVTWEGNVPNRDLPGYLARAKPFVLPSLYEGHPKVLIEAMACSVPVLGADSPGIRNLVTHGDTGYLCGTDALSIRRALQELLGDPDLCREIGANARGFAVEHYSLDKIATMEMAMLNEVIDHK